MSLDEWLRGLFSALHTVGFERGSELSDPLIPDSPTRTAELGPAQTPQQSLCVTSIIAIHMEYLWFGKTKTLVIFIYSI